MAVHLKNQATLDYYNSFESRIGYQLILGGTRHFGFYKTGTYWPFPINRSLRAMEDELIYRLKQQKGSFILDAGCGGGYVAMHLAHNGYRVHGIDIVDRHLASARANVRNRGFEGMVRISKCDYHDLSRFEAPVFDAVYTMETFVHATSPKVVANEFFRVLHPGGSLVLFEYDHLDFSTQPQAIVDSWKLINHYTAMPGNFRQGVLGTILRGAGFEEILVEDLTENVLPMLRLFYLLAFIPYTIISLLGLKHRFPNTVAGYEGYVGRRAVRYIVVSARKPLAG